MEKIKKVIRQHPIVYKYLKSILQDFRFFKTNIVGFKAPKVLDSEINFFKAIYKDCQVIADVGARFDIDYIEIGKKLDGKKRGGVKYFLFEANPVFFKRLIQNLNRAEYKENIVAENIGVGNHSSTMDYYEDSQSFVYHKKNVIKKSRVKKIKIIRLDDYFDKFSSINVDFLKIDIEGYDFYALEGMGKMLKKCKYIQFELVLNDPHTNIDITFKDYDALFDGVFDLYILQDINNPYLQGLNKNIDLFILDEHSKIMIKNAFPKGVGFNIVAINKKNPLEDLKIGQYLCQE
jgi:FkbM family methyltransferase